MKNKKLSISIVSAFIAALGLTACSNVSANEKGAIVTVHGANNTSIEIKADDIYDKFKQSEDGISSFYQAILEVFIRDYFENSDESSAEHKLYEGFVESAKNDVLSDQQKARDNAETNNTSYDVEWKAILDAANVENENELREHHIYKYEKAEYQDTYFEDHRSELTNEYIGFKDGAAVVSDKSSSMYPYHIRHILVKTSASATDYVTGEITAAEAQKLSTVYKALVEGRNTFGQVAKLLSDDGSAASYGDAGIMTTATSFVNEFKLGIYAYDMIYGDSVTGNKTLKDANTGLGLTGSYNESAVTIKDKLNETGLETVPFTAFEFLGQEYDTETNNKGLKVNDGLAKTFPRNIIWNEYLNKHNVFVITDKDEDNILPTATVSEAKPGKTGFRNVPGLGLSQKVLTDEDGRVIVGVRSEFGIHFMIMERTPFELDGTITGVNAGVYTRDNTSISDYYTTFKPGDNSYPTTENGKDKVTYVNFMNSEASTYADRAKTVKDEIKGFDKMYDYRMFEDLQKRGTIKINDAELTKSINTYIENKREYNMWNNTKTLNDAWNTYLDKISLQNEVREKTDENGNTRLVKVTCAVSFKNSDGTGAWGEGGDCYYEA